MHFLQDTPIKRKLTLISMLSSGVALLVACAVVVGFETVSFRRGMLMDLLMTARIIGDNSAAALSFSDPVSAEQTLRSLSADEHVTAAIIYDAAGEPFARFQPPGANPLTPPPVECNVHRFNDDYLELFQDGFRDDYLEVFRDITDAGGLIGTVYLRHDMLELRKNLLHSIYLVLGVMVAASLVALLLTRKLQPLVAGPIMGLAQVVRDVAINKDFSMRATKAGNDEVGRLIDGFNDMLSQVQQRDSALEAAKDGLERRVAERTEELATSLSVLHATLESTADGILAVDLQGKVVCYNTKFAVMWGIPSVMLERLDAREFVTYAAALMVDPGLFSKTIEGPYTSSGGEAFEVIELKDGRTIERYTQPQQTGGQTVGMVTNFRDITERKRGESALEVAYKRLMDTSRQAGMAEVATSVLHNVGNVLNSVNVSCSVVADKVRKSRVGSVAKTAELLRLHAANLAAFLTSDSTGKKLPDFLSKLAGRLAEEQTEVLRELQVLGQNIEHIKDIVAMQQTYAKISGLTETVQVADLVEDSLRMNDGALLRHDVQVIREYAEVPSVTVERHKVLQVLVNLMRNAKYACDESGRSDKRMTVRVSNGADRVRVAIEDNGVGIPAENLTRIFSHGFTTRKDGHGFGLHSAVLAAQEMQGDLTVYSGGPGAGAIFTLELPLSPDGDHSP